jgi:hypothetical protein
MPHPDYRDGDTAMGNQGTSRHEAEPPRLTSAILVALLLLQAATALAFPLTDPTNQNEVPIGTELTAPEAEDLQHQLQLADGLTAPAGGGWTILPRFDLQEMLTDNVLQQNAPRQWDFGTFVSPGIGVAGNSPRLQLTFDYSPTLAFYAHASSLNALTEQLNGVGLVTLLPDLAYIDVRALAGVHGIYGGIGGLGTVGASASAASASAATVASLASNSVGLNKSNEVQTDSFAISPYLLRRFGDYGTGKLGYSLGVTQSSLLTGFASIPGEGNSQQSQVTNEEVAHFATGEFLGNLQDVFDVDLQQSNSNTGGIFVTGTSGLPPTSNNIASTKDFISNRVNYVVDRAITVFVSGGHENITYPGVIEPIDDLTWSIGTTLTPSPSSLLTISYGHLNGFNSLSVDGHYDLTARTTFNLSYGSTFGTQLQNLQGQLNLATVNSTGSLVNIQTGGALFSNVNGLGVQNGVFRTDTLVVGGRTTLDRDTLSANVYFSKQTQIGVANSPTSSSNVLTLQWTHELQADLTISAAVAYSRQDQASGVLNPGESRSEAASVALQYQISQTLAASVRYAFFDRQSAVASFTFYQNLLIVGVAKTF